MDQVRRLIGLRVVMVWHGIITLLSGLRSLGVHRLLARMLNFSGLEHLIRSDKLRKAAEIAQAENPDSSPLQASRWHTAGGVKAASAHEIVHAGAGDQSQHCAGSNHRDAEECSRPDKTQAACVLRLLASMKPRELLCKSLHGEEMNPIYA
eukprot:scaffold60373_cov29-Prasinocladus_malaysianus.AAC.3